jgi:hypothetical protein
MQARMVHERVEVAEVIDGWSELIEDVKRHRRTPMDPQARDRMLGRVMALGCSTVPGTISCSITVHQGGGRFTTLTFHGEVATRLDDVQYRSGDGPCLRAALTGRPERIDRMSDDDRWPAFAGTAIDLGVRASLSVPVPRPAGRAALNLYSSHDAGFEPRRPQLLAGLVARTAATVLREPPDQPDTSGDPGPADDPRMVVARRQADVVRAAQRSVMARLDLDADAAYHELALRTRTQQLPLVDVARAELS